jgi:hypothetical protein
VFADAGDDNYVFPRLSPRVPLARARIALLVGGLALAALAGCLDASSPSPAVEREAEIEPGGFHELDLAVNASEPLTYEWSTSPASELAFDVHSHPSPDEVTYHERANATAHQGTFTAPQAGTYSLLWRNPGEGPVTVEIRLEGEVEVVSVAS